MRAGISVGFLTSTASVRSYGSVVWLVNFGQRARIHNISLPILDPETSFITLRIIQLLQQSTQYPCTIVDPTNTFDSSLPTLLIDTDLQSSHTQANHYIKMPSSHLRLQLPFEEPIEVSVIYNQTSPINTRPAKRAKKMGLTESYYIASSARGKLGREASRADHNLRRLVGHANLLDNLMIELQDAEREQEAWFHQSVRTASKPDRVTFAVADTLDEMDEDSDSDSEDEEEYYEEVAPRRRARSPAPTFMDIDEDMEFDTENDDDLSLTRVPSHSPPELTMDEDDGDSSDDDECPSPSDIALEFSEKEQQQIATAALYDLKSQSGMEDYIAARPIAAC